jgi:metal-responsive CopG/Arc/MetJ family transcriptional regulator
MWLRENQKLISIAVDKNTLNMLDRCLKKDFMNRSQFVNKTIEKYLEECRKTNKLQTSINDYK